jgi:predicted DNA repair protein MutK
MSVGLIALLDDVAAIAKAAAASLDDISAQAMKAGAKSAGVVIDDAAVTPRYVTGLPAAREIPIVAKIARGSLRNKLVFLLPLALLLAAFAPWAVAPILMLGGAFLCYEGAEKVWEALFPHAAHEHEAKLEEGAETALALEDRKVASAIKTDLILSAEIMFIALASIEAPGIWTKAGVLAVVGLGITAIVYGGVALIVKADDMGLALASRGRTALGRALGRGLVRGMPGFLRALAIVGTAAMVWVGGGIILHGLETLGIGGPAHVAHDLAHAVAEAAGGLAGWAVQALVSGIAGLAVGLALIPIVGKVVAPLWQSVRGQRT